MEVQRSILAKILAGIFIVNLVVMGVGAWYTYQKAPEIPETIVSPDGETVVTAGYDVARSVRFHNSGQVQTLMWARMPGDVLLIGGALTFAVATVQSLYSQRSTVSEHESVVGRAIPGDD